MAEGSEFAGWIYAKTLEEFNTQLSAGKVEESAIAIIEDEAYMWTHGVFFPFLRYSILITLYDSDSSSLLSGATLQFVNSSGTVIDEWVTSGKSHTVKVSSWGTYYVKEVSSPIGYETMDDVEVIINQDTNDAKSVACYNTEAANGVFYYTTQESEQTVTLITMADYVNAVQIDDEDAIDMSSVTGEYTYTFSSAGTHTVKFYWKSASLTSLKECFKNCTFMTSMDEDVFDALVKNKSFSYTFYGCTSLTSIPTGLFDNNTAVTTFSYTFYGCTSLTSIPTGLFDNNTAVTTFSHTFGNCSAVTSIPTGLFDNNTAVTTFSFTFCDCSAVTSIPTGLFDNNTAVTTFSYTFAIINGTWTNGYLTTASGLSSDGIPANLFMYNTAVTNFSGVFSGQCWVAGVRDIFSYSNVIVSLSVALYTCTDWEKNVRIYSEVVSDVSGFHNNNSASNPNYIDVYVPSGSTTYATFLADDSTCVNLYTF